MRALLSSCRITRRRQPQGFFAITDTQLNVSALITVDVKNFIFCQHHVSKQNEALCIKHQASSIKHQASSIK